MGALLRAIKESGLRREEVVIVSGIGCTGRITTYLKFDTAHVLHGRAIPFAVGVKLAKPELKVIAIGGDGDMLGIGGNHLIHAARRNVGILVIVVNNGVYAMTGGQLAPTTPTGARTTTSPYGNLERPFNVVALASSAGASYVARWTTAHPVQLKESIKEALFKKGFSLIEVFSHCPTIYGRLNKLGGPADMIKLLARRSVIKEGAKLEEAVADWRGRIVCGVFVNREGEEFSEKLRREG
ncbi:MAG: hypothetical protein B6U69_01235 [Thermofilum sp. ex4484_15]|nr:MAG: hypothetical protein B6U69_01235 [Thermofilum sp. ex4484_15]